MRPYASAVGLLRRALGAARELLRVGHLVDRDLRPLGHPLEQPSRELVQMGLGEMAVERVAVGPLLHRHEAQGVLDGGEEPVSQAAILLARVLLHLLEQRDHLIAVLRVAPHPADHEHHLLRLLISPACGGPQTYFALRSRRVRVAALVAALLLLPTTASAATLEA